MAEFLLEERLDEVNLVFVFLSSDLLIAVIPLPPMLNLFENLLLLLRLNTALGIYRLEVNRPSVGY